MSEVAAMAPSTAVVILYVFRIMYCIMNKLLWCNVIK
jgi:hypothetical protein